MLAEHAGETDTDEARLAAAVNDLLLPIVKGYGSERSWVLLGTQSLQTFGGSGFLSEYPLEQYVRNAKIDTLYEGTTAIQGQDFFFRKIVKDQGQALGHLAGQIQSFINPRPATPAQNRAHLLAKTLEDANAIVGHMINDLMSARLVPTAATSASSTSGPQHHPPAHGPGRPGLRLAAAPPARGLAGQAGRRRQAGTGFLLGQGRLRSPSPSTTFRRSPGAGTARGHHLSLMGLAEAAF